MQKITIRGHYQRLHRSMYIDILTWGYSARGSRRLCPSWLAERQRRRRPFSGSSRRFRRRRWGEGRTVDASETLLGFAATVGESRTNGEAGGFSGFDELDVAGNRVFRNTGFVPILAQFVARLRRWRYCSDAVGGASGNYGGGIRSGFSTHTCVYKTVLLEIYK